jgi:formylglycine-generating enzyme required for sulfatase activity
VEWDHVPTLQKEMLKTEIAQLYELDPDPGVNSACVWLWRLKLQAGELPPVADSSSSRRWFDGPRGHRFIVVPPQGAVMLGSPEHELWREQDEAPHETSLHYSLAVASHEVTVAQFSAFGDSFGNRRYSPTPECPMNNVSWFDAAAYCRWLSEQDGVTEDQMCYPPVGEIGPGMKLPEDWQSRTGYRLPTPAEWEVACRAGVAATRFFGEGDALFAAYAVALPESDDRTWPAGSLKPNPWGLFDILGNIGEWCQPDVASGEAMVLPREMPRRGGDFGDAMQNVRAARLTAAPADALWGNTGFRVVRRMPEP